MVRHWGWAVGYAMIGAFLGGNLDLIYGGDGIAALILTLVGSALGVRCTVLLERAKDRHAPMAAAMAGMLVGALAGLVGVTVALLTVHQADTMTWSMILMGGSMGGMIGGSLGPHLAVVIRLHLGTYRIEI